MFKVGEGASFAFDGLNQRVQKTSNGTTYDFVLGLDGKPFDEYQGTSFTRVTGGLFTYANNSTYFNRIDDLTMPRLSTDYTGAVARKEGVLMGPYGDGFTETGTFIDFTGFAGGFWDSENNADHFGAREYSKAQGRWFTPDPAGLAAVDPTNPQSWNRYAYIMNNPTSYTDPLGLECVWDDGSYDSEFDSETGSVRGCGDAGGTWVELGQNGNWSNQADQWNQDLVASIQAGQVGQVDVLGQNGFTYQTMYSGGQTTETVTPDATTFYSDGQPITNVSQMLSFPTCFSCRGNTFTSIFTPQQIRQFALTQAWSRDLGDFFHKNWWNGGEQLRSGDATCQIHMTIDLDASVTAGGAVGDYHVDQYAPYTPYSLIGPFLHTRELALGGTPMSFGPTGCLTRNTF